MITQLNGLEFYGNVLSVREAQMAITSSNLSNQDTPNYKAKGIEFKDAMKQLDSGSSAGLLRTDPRHLQGIEANQNFNIMYSSEGTPKADGNTVNEHFEKNEFSKQQIMYQAALKFAKGSKDSIVNSLKTE